MGSTRVATNFKHMASVAVVMIAAGGMITADSLAQSAAAGRPLATTAAATNANRPVATNTVPVATRVRPALIRRPLPPAIVQWQAAITQSARMQSQRKPNSLAFRLPKAQIDATRLPVLLPREGLITTAAARMVSLGDAYSLNLPQAKGTQVTMYGNRSFVPADKGAVSARPVTKLPGIPEDIRISQIEDGWTATFTRYGVVYSIDVSCDVTDSPDCAGDGYIRKAIAEFTDVTMGANAQSEAKQQVKAPPASIFSKLFKTGG